MTTAEAMHAHLTEQHAAAVRELDYARRHARAAERNHAASPSPETSAALANATASVQSAETALEQAVAKLANQARTVNVEKLAADKPV